MIPAHYLPCILSFLLAAAARGQEEDPKTKKTGPPTPEGLKALQHPDAKVRYRAVETLAQVGPLATFAIPELRELLKDKNGYVRVKAAEAMWKIDKSPAVVLMPVLLQALKDKEAGVRAAAPPVIALLGSKAKAALPALVQALSDKDFDARLSAITALGDLGAVAKDSADDLLGLARDKDFFLLEPFVGAALANLGENAIPKLTAALADKSGDRRRVAAYALGAMGSGAASAVSALADTLRFDDPATRKQAAVALGKIGKDARAAVPKLEAALGDKDEGVRIEAVVAIWSITGQAKHEDVLVKLLNHLSAHVCEAACKALGTMKADAKDAVEPLMKLLQDRDLRIRAILTLGEIGPAAVKAVPDLRSYLKDRGDGEAQLSAAFAIWQITGQAKESLPIIENGLGSEKHDRLAIRLLGDMGEAGQPLLATLVAMYRAEEVASYRQLMAASIKKIDPAAAKKLGIR